MEGIQTIELLLFMILMLLVILCGYLFFGQESEKKEKNGMSHLPGSCIFFFYCCDKLPQISGVNNTVYYLPFWRSDV